MPLTLSTLFPLAPTETAGEKLSALMSSIRQSLARLSKSTSEPKAEPCTSYKGVNLTPGSNAEVDRLQAIIDKLRVELGAYMRI